MVTYFVHNAGRSRSRSYQQKFFSHVVQNSMETNATMYYLFSSAYSKIIMILMMMTLIMKITTNDTNDFSIYCHHGQHHYHHYKQQQQQHPYQPHPNPHQRGPPLKAQYA